MTRHIAFCLEEIDAEIEALPPSILADDERQGLLAHVAAMRGILEQVDARALTRAPGDDLGRIKGIGPDDVIWLSAKGHVRYSDIAAWRRPDIDALEGGRALLERIAAENWIEQAAILASGHTTHFAAEQAARASEAASIAAIADALQLAAMRDIPADRSEPEQMTAEIISLATAKPAGTQIRARIAARVAALMLAVIGLGALGASQLATTGASAAAGSLGIR